MSRALRNLMVKGGEPLETKIMVPAVGAITHGLRVAGAKRRTAQVRAPRKPKAGPPRLGANPSLDRFNKIEKRGAAKPKTGVLRGSVFDVAMPKAPKARGGRGRR